MKKGIVSFLCVSIVLLMATNLVAREKYASKKYVESENAEEGTNASGSIAVAMKVVNDVLRQKVNQEAWNSIKRGDVFFENDNVRTGSNSFCVLSFIDGTTSRVLENTQVKINIKKNVQTKRFEGKSVDVSFGKVTFNVKNRPGEDFKFVSPTSVASIKGTVGTYGSYQDLSVLVILEGRAELQAVEGNKVFVSANQIGSSTKDKAVVRDLTEDETSLENKLIQSTSNNVTPPQAPTEPSGSDKKETSLEELMKDKPEGITIKIKDKNGNIITKTIRP